MKSAGFTLIELLITIALIGILAMITIVSLNPIERIGRAKDLGRKSAITSIGRSLQNYNAINSTLPSPANLKTTLLNSSELKSFPQNPSGVSNTCSDTSGMGAVLVDGFCYNVSNTSDAQYGAVIYSRLESNQENNKCSTPQIAWFVWSFLAGGSGIVCTSGSSTEPPLTTISFQASDTSSASATPTDEPPLTSPTIIPTTAPLTTPTPTTSPYLFDDEFDGTTLDTNKWIAMNRHGDTSNSEIQCYLPSNVAVSGGTMTITSKVDPAGCASIGESYQYSSAMIQWPTYNFKYGRVDIRAKMTGGSGAWPALWFNGSDCQPSNITWADDPNCNWPQPGSDEIDMAEFLNNNYTAVNQQIHSGANNGGCQPTITNATNNWHIYSMIWQPGQLQWLVDNNVTCTIASGVPSSNMFLMINTAIGGVGGGFVNSSTFPQTHQVDYVRVSALPPTPTPTPTPASQMKNPSSAANNSSSGTITWSNPSFITADDSQKATFTASGTTISNYLNATNFGFSIPTGSTITGIAVDIKKQRSGGSSGNVIDNKVYIVKNGTIMTSTNKATSTNWPTTDSFSSYGSSGDLWGQMWTSADINDANFGVVISARGTTSGSNRVANVNNIRITVYYQ